jgi:hypothetical protein
MATSAVNAGLFAPTADRSSHNTGPINRWRTHTRVRKPLRSVSTAGPGRRQFVRLTGRPDLCSQPSDLSIQVHSIEFPRPREHLTRKQRARTGIVYVARQDVGMHMRHLVVQALVVDLRGLVHPIQGRPDSSHGLPVPGHLLVCEERWIRNMPTPKHDDAVPRMRGLLQQIRVCEIVRVPPNTPRILVRPTLLALATALTCPLRIPRLSPSSRHVRDRTKTIALTVLGRLEARGPRAPQCALA